MPVAMSTGQMIAELERVKSALNGLHESLRETFNLILLKEIFAHQLVLYGVAKGEAETLAEGLVSWVVQTQEFLDAASATTGSALHVVHRAQAKARNNVAMV